MKPVQRFVESAMDLRRRVGRWVERWRGGFELTSALQNAGGLSRLPIRPSCRQPGYAESGAPPPGISSSCATKTLREAQSQPSSGFWNMGAAGFEPVTPCV